MRKKKRPKPLTVKEIERQLIHAKITLACLKRMQRKDHRKFVRYMQEQVTIIL